MKRYVIDSKVRRRLYRKHPSGLGARSGVVNSLSLGVACALAAGACGCGGGAGARHVLPSTDAAIALLRHEGYKQVRRALPARGTSFLAFPMNPIYGRPVAEFVRSKFVVVVIQGTRGTPRPDNPDVYWLRSGSVILMGVPQPGAAATGKREFAALTRHLE
jgi:hypothetical protein